MTTNNIIEFSIFLRSSFTKQITIVEYTRRGRIWSRTSGKLVRQPQLVNMTGYMLQMRLHHFDADELVRSQNAWSDAWLHSSDYHDFVTWEVVAGGTLGILRGFNRHSYDVDVYFHI